MGGLIIIRGTGRSRPTPAAFGPASGAALPGGARQRQPRVHRGGQGGHPLPAAEAGPAPGPEGRAARAEQRSGHPFPAQPQWAAGTSPCHGRILGHAAISWKALRGTVKLQRGSNIILVGCICQDRTMERKLCGPICTLNASRQFFAIAVSCVHPPPMSTPMHDSTLAELYRCLGWGAVARTN